MQIEEHILEDMIDTLTQNIRSADSLLDQVALASEWHEWYSRNHEIDVLLVSEFLDEVNK
mgnify:FL=1|tara:strand:+ start:312 stop:491 length:180 start_codon:yes stop_codon:yes gene_type:complete